MFMAATGSCTALPVIGRAVKGVGGKSCFSSLHQTSSARDAPSARETQWRFPPTAADFRTIPDGPQSTDIVEKVGVQSISNEPMKQ
jgi:hypothetical protein